MNKIISDISDYIFVSDEPEKVDAIFLPGGSHPEQPEYAAELYRKGYAKWLIPSGGVSVKRDKWPGVRSKAEIYNGDYQSDCEFFTDVFVKNGVPKEAIIGEDKSGHTRDNAFFSRKVVDESGIDIKTGVYAFMGGPNYETPAEIKMLSVMGADAVGMSTVPEVISAAHCGIKTLAVSCITNMAAGICENPISHEEVFEVTNKFAAKMEELLKNVIFEIQ